MVMGRGYEVDKKKLQWRFQKCGTCVKERGMLCVKNMSRSKKIMVPKPLEFTSCHHVPLITDKEMQDKIFALLWFGVHPCSVSLFPPFGMVMLILFLSHHCTNIDMCEALFNTSSWQRVWGLKSQRN